jgi:hypothetical protein
MIEETITLWRPVGPKELALIEEAGMRAFPPRLPEQPIFYPILTEAYAIKIARDWNVRADGGGFVTRLLVRRRHMDQYEVHEAGGEGHLEYWIPAEELDAFNASIVGQIEVVHSFRLGLGKNQSIGLGFCATFTTRFPNCNA